MIVGHGIDIEWIDRIEEAHRKSSNFSRRILTDKELDVFETLQGHRQMTYLAGRWSAKEAFSKALGTGIGQLSFRDIEVLNDRAGRPVLTSSAFSGRVHLSISHSGNLVQASVILEEI
ncbi:holo-ACP synthase [Streptococcus fryi]